MLSSRGLLQRASSFCLSSRLSSTATSSKTASATPTALPHISTSSGGYKFDNSRYGKDIVLVEGVRTPFAQSMTDYEHLMSYELMSYALSSLMKRVPIAPKDLNYVVCGTNLHEPRTPNVAREAVLG